MPLLQQSLRDLAGKQKTSKGVSLYSRFVNRPVGRVVAAAAHVLGMTPNQVTAVSAVLTAVGVVGMAGLRPTPLVSVLVWLSLALGFAFDSADGQLARLRGGGSPAGEWLDHATDAGKAVAVHLAVLVMLYRFENPWGVAGLVAALAFTVISSVMFAGGILAELLRRVAGAPRPTEPARPSIVRAVGLLPADYGVLCAVFLLTWWSWGFGLAYIAMTALNLIILVALCVKWFRELSRPLATPSGHAL